MMLFKNLKIYLAVSDYFFDTDDYSSPLKVNFRNDIAFYPTDGFLKLVNIKVKYNTISDLSSPYPFASSSSYEFYSISDIRQDMNLDTSGNLLQIRFALDNEYQQISRTVYNWSDAVSQIGGFGGLMLSIFSFLVGVLSTKIYSQTVMSNIYQVESAAKPQFLEWTKIVPEESKSHEFKTKNKSLNLKYESRYF